MVKKQNNINWMMWIFIIIAVVALVLAIVAMNRANMTGNAFLDFLRSEEKIQERTQETTSSGSGGAVGTDTCLEPEYGNCMDDCAFGPNPESCYPDCDAWCGAQAMGASSTGNENSNCGADGITTISYIDEATGNSVKISQAIITPDNSPQYTVTCSQSCPGGDSCLAIGCEPLSSGYCSKGNCKGDCGGSAGTCTRSLTATTDPSQN